MTMFLVVGADDKTGYYKQLILVDIVRKLVQHTGPLDIFAIWGSSRINCLELLDNYRRIMTREELFRKFAQF